MAESGRRYRLRPGCLRAWGFDSLRAHHLRLESKMPNHCSNVMTVVGSPLDVQSFVDKANGVGPNYPSQGLRSDLPRGERRKPEDLPVSVLSFHQTVPIPEEDQAAGYSDAGYNAERKLWGVEWGAYDEELISHGPGRAKYVFTTAWAPPKTWLLRTSVQFPELTFYVSYSEESPSRGQFIVRNGETRYEIHDSYPFDGEFPEYDGEAAETDSTYEDRHFKKCVEVTEKYMHNHDSWVDDEIGR